MGALQAYLNQQKRYGFVVVMDAGVLPEIKDKQAETALYLIIQEALTNVRKHAQASHTWLRLRLEDPWLTAEIEDDGRGFAVERLTARYLNHTHLGLLSMRERAGWLGGSVEITSPRPGHVDGTLLKAQIPSARLTTPPREDTASWLVASRKLDSDRVKCVAPAPAGLLMKRRLAWRRCNALLNRGYSSSLCSFLEDSIISAAV